MNALDFLKKEHEKAKGEFKKIEQASPGERASLWTKLEPELKVHERIEEAHLFGPIARDPKAKGTTLEDWDGHHSEEVGEAKDLIGILAGLDPSTDEWLDNVKELRSLLEHHIREEEDEIWPEIRRVWDAEQLDEAGTKMEKDHAAKMEQMTRAS